MNKAGSETSTALSATWASWAVSSLTSKFYGSKISNANSVTSNQGSISANPSSNNSNTTNSGMNNMTPPYQDDDQMIKTNHSSLTAMTNEKSSDEQNDDIWGNSGDGWDETDAISPFDEPSNINTRARTPNSELKGKSDWSFDDPLPEMSINPVLNEVEERRKKKPVEVKELEITREVVSNARKIKKGPMKLGAKKI